MTHLIDALLRLEAAATPGPWGHGDGACGAYLDYQAHADERGGPEPLSDYNGREPVWLGGSVSAEDRQLIAFLRNHARTFAAWGRVVQRAEAVRAQYEHDACPGGAEFMETMDAMIAALSDLPADTEPKP